MNGRDVPARAVAAVACLAAVILLGACVSPHPSVRAVAADENGPPVTYVAVGDSESVGVGTDDPLRDAWPQQFYRQALPRRTVFVNLGIPGATVEQATKEEVDQALALAPTLVTVWLNVNDLSLGHPVAAYEQQLGGLVHRLRRDGATKVLLANTPPLADLVARGPAAELDAYNQAIARVASREGAVLVDIHAAYLAAQGHVADAELMGRDGIHPAAAGHTVVATAFAQALAGSGGVR